MGWTSKIPVDLAAFLGIPDVWDCWKSTYFAQPLSCITFHVAYLVRASFHVFSPKNVTAGVDRFLERK